MWLAWAGQEDAMEDQASFGYWVRRRRKALDLTQSDLAARVGCAVITIQKIEADTRRPSRQIAERLAEALALPPGDRAAFLYAARAELAPDRLADPLPHREQRPPERATALSLPSGTVTFLFTDIEGSTQLWEHAPQAMQAALARHDTLLRAIIEQDGGVVVKMSGDGVHAAFARAPDALAAALAAQRAFQTQEWGALDALQVRMALHTGVSEERAGDYFGPVLNRVARVLATGHGGQVLLSRATQELVRDHLPPEVELRDLGEHRLKDLTRPEHIFQLTAPGLPADFPPLRSLDSHRHNLPAQATPLIGREREVAHVTTQLRRSDVRLVTLLGPGGTGKTRLAFQIAAELVDAFVDGVWFVPLAAVRDPSLVVATISQTLGLKEVGSQSPREQLTRYLSAKQLLLVLDNFEQLLDAAPLVAELLAHAPNLSVLVTSRAVLHLSGEQEFVVPPLSLPDRQHPPALEQLTQYEAVRLFIARAQAVKSEFSVTNQNAPAVAEICARLDGLPLAIELAAARIKLFTPEALLTRLEQRLPFLTGGARDLPLRQQTLRDTIAWSYALLDAAEQALFRRLGVFVGSCTLEAAEVVCSDWGSGTGDRETSQSPVPDPQSPILDGLAALMDKSLLKQVEGMDGAPRFTMLETIREFALEQLERCGEADTVRQRHMAYYLALAEAATPALRGPQQLVWLARLEQAHDNLQAALQWTLDQRALDQCLRFANALWRFWEFHSHLSVGRGWMEAVLAQSHALRLPLRAQVLCGAGWLAYDTDRVRAQTLWNESLALAREVQDSYSIGMAVQGVGQIAEDQGDYDQAHELYDEGLRLFRELGDSEEIGWSLYHLCSLARQQGDYVQAQALGEESLAHLREIGHRWGIAVLLQHLGYVANAQGDTSRAAQHFQEAIALFRDMGDRMWIASAAADLGEIVLLQADYTRAVDLFRTSLPLFRDLGHEQGIGWCLRALGRVATAQERLEQAARLFGAAETLIDTGQMHVESSQRKEWDRNIATLHARMDEVTFAAAWAAGRAMSLEAAIEEALGEAE
jgi:predicted ATPase/class 3 adenylate cyclase